MRTNKLSPVQLMTLTVSSMLGTEILTLQRDLTEIAGRDGWISVLLGGVIILIGSLVIVYPLCETLPDLDFPQMMIKVFGNFWGRVSLLFTICYLTAYTSLSTKLFLYALEFFLLERTPIYVLSLCIVSSVVYISCRGINGIAASIDFMFPVYMGSLLLLAGLSIGQFDEYNIQPILFRNTANVLKGTLYTYSSLVGFGVIAFMYCFTYERRLVRKWYIIGITVAVLIFTILTFATIAVLGPAEVSRVTFPTVVLAQTITSPASYIERLESLIVSIYIPGVYAFLVLLIYALMRSVSVMFGIPARNKNRTGVFIFILVYIISVIPMSNMNALMLISKTKVFAGVLASIQPLALLLTAKWKKKLKKL